MSLKIRFVAGAVAATIGCVSFAAGITYFGWLFYISWLVLMPIKELAQPVGGKELALSFLLIGVLLAILIGLPLLHLHLLHPGKAVCTAIAVPMWILWMWMFYRRWRQEKAA
ncbi:MAG TPA: hypothetical protein VMF08_07065 [Candidatus Sulfotelmatobacter sp.]|nr:hypothetical protein [Candidatus Sulfotelmatobacter sp.]